MSATCVTRTPDATTDDVEFPYESYDYPTSNITLGISFPPMSNADQYQFAFDKMSDLNMNRLRLDIHWNTIESTQGTRVWSGLQTRLDAIAAQGYKAFLTIDLKSFPVWFASVNETNQQSVFRNFVHELLANFKDKIKLLAIWQ